MNALDYPSYTAATASKQIRVGALMCGTKWIKVVEQGTIAKDVSPSVQQPVFNVTIRWLANSMELSPS
jgi:hypothetical protein